MKNSKNNPPKDEQRFFQKKYLERLRYIDKKLKIYHNINGCILNTLIALMLENIINKNIPIPYVVCMLIVALMCFEYNVLNIINDYVKQKRFMTREEISMLSKPKFSTQMYKNLLSRNRKLQNYYRIRILIIVFALVVMLLTTLYIILFELG